MKKLIKELFRQWDVILVFIMCGLFHIFIFTHFKIFFSIGWVFPTVFITLSNIGATLCIVYALRKLRGK